MNFRIYTLTPDEKKEYFKTATIDQKTKMYLNECKKLGIKLVSIGRATNEIPDSLHWKEEADNIFANERHGTWPAIWKPGEILGVSSCGNSCQAQLRIKLIQGIYRLVNDTWIKEDKSI